LRDFPNGDKEIQQLTASLNQTDNLQTSAATNATGEAAVSATKGRVLRGPYKADSFAALGLGRDVIASIASGQRAKGIAWTHRNAPDFDIYFISNQLDSARTIDLSLRAVGRKPELWDAVTGETYTATDWKTEDGRTLLPLHLDRNGSIFVVFRESGTQTSAQAGSNWVEVKPLQTIDGAWQVQFDQKMNGPAQPVVFAQLTDWSKHTDDAIQHYSGTAAYSQTFKWKPTKGPKPHVYLDLGQVANLAEVQLNGKPVGIAWTAPYRLDITDALKKGDNQLRILVTNTWANRLLGEQGLPADQRRTWTPAPLPTVGKPLLPAGLLGPVTLGVSN
jgi:hypothetical protein